MKSVTDLTTQGNSFSTAWIAPTYNCNNKCLWCYAGGSHKEKEMPIEKAHKLVKLLKELKVQRLTLIGGEPTTYQKLEEIIEHASGEGIQTGMVTNGIKLSNLQFTKRMKESGVKGVGITILGTEEIHDKITQVNGSYKQTIKGLINCKKNGIDVTTNTVISEYNQHALDNIIELAQKLDIRKTFFNICSDCIVDQENSYSLSPLKASDITKDFLLRNREHHELISIVTPLPLCNFEEHAEEFLRKGLVKGSCAAFYGDMFAIDYNGDVLPCPHFTGFPFFNIFKSETGLGPEEFKTKFFSKDSIAEKFRDKLWHYPSKKCINSEKYGKICTAGCPIQWLNYNPELNIKGGEKNE